MVAGFSRSFSLPGSPRRPVKTRHHTRSVSLPASHSHPLIDEIRSVNAWIHSSHPEPASSAHLCDGLARLELLHVSLNHLLHLPHTQHSLRGTGSGSEWTDRILDDFLRLADAHGTLRCETLSLNDHQCEAQIALRRKDTASLESCVRLMKKTERQLLKLPASLRVSTTGVANGVEEVELIREAVGITVSASVALFVGVASVSNAAVCCLSSKKRREEDNCKAMEKLRELEECLGAVEKKSERVFRCLLNTRVALLGLMSPSL